MTHHYQSEIFSGAVDLLVIHQSNPERYPFLLESVASISSNSQYDILFAFPQQTLVLENPQRLTTSRSENLHSADFLTELDNWFKQEIVETHPDVDAALPFSGGWFLYLGYELAQQVEPVLKLPQQKKTRLPVAYACRIPAAIVIDKLNHETILLAENHYVDYLQKLREDIQNAEQKHSKKALQIESFSEEDPQRYIDAISRVKQYIVDGDVFQVNLSRSWDIDLSDGVAAADIYSALRKANPAPFAGLACINDSAIISSSPERLVRVKLDTVETRPIAGTRPRIRDEQNNIDKALDDALRAELIGHPKERAEHVMLIDLERNDLGRIAKPGSVSVDELMVLETYEHVHHIVSNVRAVKRDNVSPGDVIKAVFPGGTITGCPKVRCMEIIAELEQTPREAYTGSMGYLNLNGDMDLNILIRTIMQTGKQLHIRAGGGIVADSEPARELQETRAKAKGMLKAINHDFDQWQSRAKS